MWTVKSRRTQNSLGLHSPPQGQLGGGGVGGVGGGGGGGAGAGASAGGGA